MSTPQFRIIDGVLYRRLCTPYSYDLRIHDLGHGHVEALAQPRYGWCEVGACSPSALADAEMAKDHIWSDGDWLPKKESEQELLDKAARNRERSARRARTQVRRLVKAKNLDTMLTLTYQENMTERARMARDFDVFMKRVRRLLPAFEYVCVFEQQKRGAWHAHIAVQRICSHYLYKGTLVKSYDLLRSIWRAVVGSGNVDVSRALRKRQRNIGKLAGYLSKYIAKGFDAGQEGDSYRASGRALPKPVVVRSLATNVVGAASDLASTITAFWPDGEFYSALLDGGGYFISITP